ncbi:hypothetical protein JCM3770_003934 [Rhodotorula araucariae]
MTPPHALLSSPLHRIPTRWSLYRPLLRAAQSAPLDQEHCRALQRYVRDGFKRARNLGSVDRARRKLVEAEQFLHQLEGAAHSATHLSNLRALASHLLLRRPPSPPRPARPAPPPRRKPLISPSILHSTPFNPPMPRLRPQPLATSMMIFRRRRASQKRFDKLVTAREMLALVQAEMVFDARAGAREKQEDGRWGDEWRAWIAEARVKDAKEQARNALRIPPEMQQQAREAGTERERRRKERATRRKAL